jgi:hypothetical protein
LTRVINKLKLLKHTNHRSAAVRSVLHNNRASSGSKYAPLGQYLRKQSTNLVRLTFAEIERVIGAKLPDSQRYPAWWSNNPWNNVMTKVWLDAGFETEQVDIPGRKVVFRRVGQRSPSAANVATRKNLAKSSDRRSLIGWMEGTVTIAPGVDLTEPADPEWGKRVWGDQK